MPRLSAIKLVDRAILPFVLLIATTLLAIFAGSLLFNISWGVNLQPLENNFLFFQFANSADLATIINFSDSIVVLTCGLGFVWTIFRANHLNIDKTHPRLISRLYGKGKDFWLTTTGQVYHDSTVWLGLSWLVLFLVLINVYQGLTSKFVLGMSLALTLGLTFAFYEFVRKN